MRAQDEEPHHLSVALHVAVVVLVQHLANGEEITERLGHLLVVDAHKAIVHPVVHEDIAVRALGLRNLVLVMRKLQVLATAVDIEMRAEQFAGHGRTLQMPARTTAPPGRRPGRLALLGAFPQDEIERVMLAGIGFDALARPQLIQRLAG